MERILVTGGAGFIGSHLVKRLLKENKRVVVLDNLSYSGNPKNLSGLIQEPVLIPRTGDLVERIRYCIDSGNQVFEEKKMPLKFLKKLEGLSYTFVDSHEISVNPEGEKIQLIVGSILDRSLLNTLLEQVDGVIHLAAETHVDRSILGGEKFYLTDVLGTFTLLDVLKNVEGGREKRFLHVSTDEVYGEIKEGRAREDAPLNPSNPYSSAKAGADRLAYSFFKTYGMNIIIARPSNAFGPFQHPEKFIPFMTIRALSDEHLPIYGDGRQVRDWIYVEDLVSGLLLIYERGVTGEVYNVPGGNEKENKEVARMILRILEKPEDLIRFVKDRPGHDRRYAMEGKKVKSLGFEPGTNFEEALGKTVEWYKNNRHWWKSVLEEEETRNFMEKWYKDR